MNETTREAKVMTARELGLCGDVRASDHATVYGVVVRDQTAGALGLCGTPDRGMTVDGDMLRDLIADATGKVVPALSLTASRDIADQALDDAVRAGMTVLHGQYGSVRWVEP